jgi:hypothetical protein
LEVIRLAPGKNDERLILSFSIGLPFETETIRDSIGLIEEELFRE